MSIPLAKRLAVRLVVVVGLTLLVFSAVVGVFTYRYAYAYQMGMTADLQNQLVRTVQVQAEVAAFASNTKIAQDVLEGLMANPMVLAARIESGDDFRYQMGMLNGVDFTRGRSFVLLSPVDHKEAIGRLVLLLNEAEVERTATRTALFQTALMLAQMLATTGILMLVLRRMVFGPIGRLAKAMNAATPGGASRLPLEARHQDDEIGLLARSANTILDAAQSAIEEVREQRNALEKLATHDHLTGLPTLRLADDRLQVACSNARRQQTQVALLFIDLDGFKGVNDQYGHAVGDLVLVEIAKRLQQCVREQDTAARVGGDEFMVILVNLPDPGAAAQVARNIIETLSYPFNLQGAQIELSASVGIAVYPDPIDDMGAMRRLADQAMYRVKRTGKGNFAYVDAAQLA
jgi:diguanylate cyclase (GGDEF)-like protein